MCEQKCMNSTAASNNNYTQTTSNMDIHRVLEDIVDNITCLVLWGSAKGPSIKYVTLQRGEGVWESVTICDRGRG